MENRPAHRARRWSLLIAAVASLALAAGASAQRRPDMQEARTAARAVVRDHPTYRTIRSHEPLVVRGCWRVRRAVRCSLHRWAPTPCALDGDDEGVCIQVMARRVWLVEVRRRHGRTGAHVKRVYDTSAVTTQSASARSSS